MINEQLEKLRTAYPYPEIKPDIEYNDQGWLAGENVQKFKDFLSDKTNIVVEVGAWIGLSARTLCDIANNATIISIDHWLGSVEHHSTDGWREQTRISYDTYISNNWKYRDRIIPLRADSFTGLDILSMFNIEPDLIYIDASHDYDHVKIDVDTAVTLFPNAIIVGDDWNGQGLQDAVNDVAKKHNKKVQASGNCWWYENNAE